MEDFIIRTQKDLENAVERFGILPLFRNSLPGFSVEEHAHPSVWFAGGEGVWEWKGPVIRNTHCAYGKFFGSKAVFMTREWYREFANWRRDGYDFDSRFDDELASYDDKKLFDIVEKMAPALSREIKKEGNYGKGKDKDGGFDPVMTRLQAQGYVLISDFVYLTDRHGNQYGWGVAQYSTPEKYFGPSFREGLYDREPEESMALVLDHLKELLPDCSEKIIRRYMAGNAVNRKDIGRKEWLVPSNLKYYDVISELKDSDVIWWKQGNDRMKAGDIVYIYVGVPYSAILYKFVILEADLPFTGESEHVNIRKIIRIKLLEEYPPDKLNREVLKRYDVVSVRCARSMPPKLSRDISSL